MRLGIKVIPTIYSVKQLSQQINSVVLINFSLQVMCFPYNAACFLKRDILFIFSAYRRRGGTRNWVNMKNRKWQQDMERSMLGRCGASD